MTNNVNSTTVNHSIAGTLGELFSYIFPKLSTTADSQGVQDAFTKFTNDIAAQEREAQQRLEDRLSEFKQGQKEALATRLQQYDLESRLDALSDQYTALFYPQIERFQTALNEENISLEQLQRTDDARFISLKAKLDECKDGLQVELEQLLHSHQHDQEIQDLQASLIRKIEIKQSHLNNKLRRTISELNQQETATRPVIDRQNQKIFLLNEQMQLQEPRSVKIFYNKVEALFSAKLMSALVLSAGLIERKKSGAETLLKGFSDILGSLCAGIPFVGPIVGTIVTFCTSESINFAIDHAHEQNNKGVARLVRFKDVQKMGELIARCLTKMHIEKIALFIDTVASKKGEEAANELYKYLEKNPQSFNNCKNQEEMATHLINSAISPDLFNAPQEKNHPSLPFGARPVMLNDPGKKLKHQEPTIDARICQLEAQIELMKSLGALPEVTALNKLKALDVTFQSGGFNIVTNKNTLTITRKVPDLTQVLEKIKEALQSTFTTFLISNNLQDVSLKVTTADSASAELLERIVQRWLS